MFQRDNFIRYEEEIEWEAIEAFQNLCKFNGEHICRSVAYSVLEEDKGAEKTWKDLGLTRKHALVVCGQKKAFWDDVAYSELPDIY